MIETTSAFSSSVPSFDLRGIKSSNSTTSKGNQPKWFVNNKYIKAAYFNDGRYWKDNLCEVIGSNLCKQLGVPAIEQFVCRIQSDSFNGLGVYSENFNEENEVFIAFEKLMGFTEPQIRLNDYYNLSAKDKLEMIIEVYSTVASLDATDYLRNMLLIDAVLGNEDRHLNNFGVQYNTVKKSFKLPPLFDFGLSMFEHDAYYTHVSLEACVPFLEGRTLGCDMETQQEIALECGNPFRNKTVDVSNWDFPSSNAKEYVIRKLHELGVKVIVVRA